MIKADNFAVAPHSANGKWVRRTFPQHANRYFGKIFIGYTVCPDRNIWDFTSVGLVSLLKPLRLLLEVNTQDAGQHLDDGDKAGQTEDIGDGIACRNVAHHLFYRPSCRRLHRPTAQGLLGCRQCRRTGKPACQQPGGSAGL